MIAKSMMDNISQDEIEIQRETRCLLIRLIQFLCTLIQDLEGHQLK